jgi:hypothetical protein
VNGVIAPKSIVIEVADPVPQGGRRSLEARYGEYREMLPGFVPPACSQRVPCEQGRAVGFKRELVGSAEPKSENGPMTRRQSDWLIVLRGWESQPHGEAASER